MSDSEAAARARVLALAEGDLAAMARLDRLAELLVAENGRQNLVSAASLAEVWARHILDSAQLLPFVPRETSPWLDLGTGAGFPGLVIAALRPECRVVMVESRGLRAAWLKAACAELELHSAEVVGMRLEQVGTFRAGVVSARAFAPLARLLEMAARFSDKDTVWLLPKGRSARTELDQLGNCPHMFHVEQSVTDANSGIIVGNLIGRKDSRK